MNYTISDEYKLKTCPRCGREFAQPHFGSRRLCNKCRAAGPTPEEKAAREDKRRTMPSMTRDRVLHWIGKGVNTFHNGGQRIRIVVGFDMMFTMYKSSPTSRRVTGIWQDVFAEWCRGVVINGIMCDKEGNPLEGRESRDKG